MLALIVRITVDQGQLRDVARISALQIVVTHPHQERRAAQIGHVAVRHELEVSDQRPFVPVRAQGRGGRELETHGAQRFRGDGFVTPSRNGAGDRVAVSHAGHEATGDQPARAKGSECWRAVRKDRWSHQIACFRSRGQAGCMP